MRWLLDLRRENKVHYLWRQQKLKEQQVPTVSVFLSGRPMWVQPEMEASDAFVAASFRSSLVPLSAQLAFMVLGPMLDIKLIAMYLKVFRKRAIAVLAGLTFAAVFLITVFV